MGRAGRSGCQDAKSSGFPKVLVEVYGDGVRTLRQLILQLLGPSLRLTPCKCNGPCDDLIQYCANCDPSGFLLRDDDHADYWNLLECSYAVVSNHAPRPESFTLEQRWTQRQIIERAIALQFRQETRPHNVICFGYRQPQPNNVEMGFTLAPYGLESTSSNSVMRLLNSQAWMVLLSRVGDMFMLHLLSYTSIFYPLPSNSYLQVTGAPISSLVSSFRPHLSVQSGKLGHNHPCGNPVGIGVHRTAGFHALRECSFVMNQSQSKGLIHTPVPLICESMGASVCALKSGQEMDKTASLTESTGLFQKDCKGGQKRKIFTNKINAQYKKRKGGGNKRQCITNKVIDSACAVSQCTQMWYGLGEHGQNDCACKTVQNKYGQGDCVSQTAALDIPHFGQMPSEIISSDRCSKEHAERGSICLPGSFRSRNDKCSESELVSGPNIHPELGDKTEIVGSYSNTETIPLESFHSSSCNAPTNGGRSKKRARPFSWQRRRKRRFEEKIFSSSESASHNWGLKESMNEETSMCQQLESVFSPSHLDYSLGVIRYSKQSGVALQCASSKSLRLAKNLKIGTGKSDKIFVLDQMTSLGSETLLFNTQAQNCQKMTLFPQIKGNELSSLKDRHQSPDGIVHRICCSLCCRDKDRKMVNGHQHLCADDGHICYFRSSCLPTGHDYHRYLMSGRKCIYVSHIRGAHKVDSLKATSEMKSWDPCKMPQNFVPKELLSFKKLNSQLICNSSDQRRFQQNAKSMEQGMFSGNRTKMSFKCPCWLMLHAKHRDPANTLINRRRLFYNTRFSRHAGFPLNHTLNMIKPSNSGALRLLGLIFGLPDVNVCDSCSCHENFIGGAGTFESSCIIHSLLCLLKALIRNAQHCNYARLLARHAPVNMQSSETISMKLSKVNKIPSKGPLCNLQEITGQDNNPMVAESTSPARAVQRNPCSSTGNNYLIRSGHINEAGAKFEPQSATIAECFDENFHKMGLFSKHSCWKRFVVNRKQEDHFVSGIIENKTGCDSNHTSKISNKGKTSNDFPFPSKDLENNLMNSYTSYKEVVSFIWAVCRRIIPEALLGSKCNWRALRSNIAKFVQLRRHETFSLQHCLYKLKISHFPWLNRTTLVGKHCMGLNNCNLRYKGHMCLYDQPENKEGWTGHDSTGEDKGEGNSCKMLLQQHMLADWIFWLFSSLIVPLIRAHFYVTESENGRQNVFYYQRTVWTKILNGELKDLGRNNYKRLSAVSLASILQKRSLGFSQVRFLPKKTGVRPIANLGAPSTIQLWHQKNTLPTINHRRESKLAINLTVFDRNNIRKCFKQKKSFEENPRDSVHNVPSKHNQETQRGVKGAAFQSGQQVSDDASNERRIFCDSESHVGLSFRSVNSVLCDLHYCLKLEQDHHPEDLGCSVFDYNDVYLQFLPFVLSLKVFSMGMPQLYIVVCDVAKAFDTINQDKLLGVIQNILRKEEYLIHRYTKVACRAKSVKVSYERASIPEEKGSSFTNFTSVLPKHSQCIFVDQAFITRLKRQQLLALMHEHVKRNVLQIGPHFYIQKVGIPQGSVLSSLLCSFYYGHLDRNIILPLLRQDQKQDVMGSIKATFGGYEFHGVDRHSSSSKTLIEAQTGWKITTNFHKEVNKISGSFARNNGRMRILQEGSDIAPCTNGEENEASSNILVHCPSDKLNEYETRNCKFLPSKSLLVRLIDDSLFISTSKREALCFVATMHRGFKEYNCFANEHKTALSFDMELEGKNMEKTIYRSKDGACFVRWSGLLINCHTLEIQADYTRYWGMHISSTLTVWRHRNPGYNLVVKLCQFMRPKCHPIFYDSNINSPATIRLNAYQAFLLCAMKFHAYVCSMPSVGGCSAIYLFQAIMKSTRYMHQLVKQRIYHIRLKSTITPIFMLQQKEMEWLGLYAYNKVLQRKQSRYKELVSFLVAKLHRSKYKHMASSLDLKFAVDDDCSSMFWQIQY